MNAEIISQQKHSYPVFTYFPVREKLSQPRYAWKQKQKEIPRRGTKIEMKNNKREPKSFNDLQIHDKEIVQKTSIKTKNICKTKCSEVFKKSKRNENNQKPIDKFK